MTNTPILHLTPVNLESAIATKKKKRQVNTKTASYTLFCRASCTWQAIVSFGRPKLREYLQHHRRNTGTTANIHTHTHTPFPSALYFTLFLREHKRDTTLHVDRELRLPSPPPPYRSTPMHRGAIMAASSSPPVRGDYHRNSKKKYTTNVGQLAILRLLCYPPPPLPPQS